MKRAVITGATGGIGGKTAEVLGLTGYEVIVTGIDEAGRQAVSRSTKLLPRLRRNLIPSICW